MLVVNKKPLARIFAKNQINMFLEKLDEIIEVALVEDQHSAIVLLTLRGAIKSKQLHVLSSRVTEIAKELRENIVNPKPTQP